MDTHGRRMTDREPSQRAHDLKALFVRLQHFGRDMEAEGYGAALFSAALLLYLAYQAQEAGYSPDVLHTDLATTITFVRENYPEPKQ